MSDKNREHRRASAGPSERDDPIGISIPSTEPLFNVTRRGLVAAFRVQSLLWAVVLVAFVGLKVMDRFLTRPSDAKVLETIISGILGKLDDVSFMIAIVGLACSSLVGSAALNIAAHPDHHTCAVRVYPRAVWWWLCLVAAGWAIYFYSISFPADPGEMGTFFSALAPPLRWAQVLEGVLNLVIIAVFYAYAVGGWHLAGIVRHALGKLGGSRPSAPGDVPKILQAGCQLANLPWVWLPSLGVFLLGMVALWGTMTGLHSMLGWAWLDPARHGFNPTKGLAGQLPIVLVNFVLLYLPFFVVGVRSFRTRPKWAGREWLITRESLGGTFRQEVLVTVGATQGRFACLNILLFRWYY